MKNDLLQIDDESLARTAVRGERAAFDELVRRHCRPLASFAARRTATIQDAEDITQETFLRAYLHLASYDTQYPFKNWLFTIAYRLIVSGYRKKTPVRLCEEAADSLEAGTAVDESENNWLWQAAQGMSAEDQTILWLRYKEEMAIEEIGRVMKKTKIGVRVRLHRARNRLAELIHESPDKPRQWRLQGVTHMKGAD